jgi:hypothetical protein
MSDYIRWVLKDRLRLSEKEIKENLNLVSALAEVEFIWKHPMDENRAIDGLELRSDFEYETGEYLDKTSGLMPQCTIFEMLAALAIRCENQLMRDPMVGDRTSKWFFEFLDNLEVLDGSRPVEMACDLFFKGELELFPLKNKKIKQKNEQIWKQLMAYLNENYGDDSEMLLFR